VINETAARRLWPDSNPLGATVVLDTEDGVTRAVIGVVADIPTRHAMLDADPIVYTSYHQVPEVHAGRSGSMYGALTVWLRTRGDPLALVSTVRRTATSIHPDRPAGPFNTVERQLVAGLRGLDTYVLVLMGFALTATLLALVGIHGVLTYTVSQRAREIGIRRALGASGRDVIGLVSAFGARIVVAGVGVGLLGAFLVSRAIAAQLWGVAPTDVPTYAAAVGLVVAAAAAACVTPIRRALAVDPNLVLRSE
jgi:predicted lysophospholipase L1 biosynthesis ABC-type transport system permease subunit